MSRTKVCRRLKDGTFSCVAIRRPFPVVIFDPGPIRFDAVIRKDLIALERMHHLAASLSPELRADLQAQVQTKLEQVKLPDGLSLVIEP